MMGSSSNSSFIYFAPRELFDISKISSAPYPNHLCRTVNTDSVFREFSDNFKFVNLYKINLKQHW